MQKNHKDVRGDESGNFKKPFLFFLKLAILIGVMVAALVVLDELKDVRAHWILEGLLFLAVIFLVLTGGHEKKQVSREKPQSSKTLYIKLLRLLGD
jgi:uncharacterized membrane protein AbrB (regulator of aidB expression)